MFGCLLKFLKTQKKKTSKRKYLFVFGNLKKSKNFGNETFCLLVEFFLKKLCD